jgi:hypothetical protein
MKVSEEKHQQLLGKAMESALARPFNSDLSPAEIEFWKAQTEGTPTLSQQEVDLLIDELAVRIGIGDSKTTRATLRGLPRYINSQIRKTAHQGD